MTIDYLAHLQTESARFLATLGDADPSARVPSCPDWDADDLLWHLAQVQWFWGSIVADRLQSPEAVAEQPRADSHAGLLEQFEQNAVRLHTALSEADPAAQVWMWAEDKTVGYIRRRQAHEALIHRLDAELAAGSVSPLDPELASDGVLEVLDVMFGGCPPWGSFTPSGEHVRVLAEDTGTVVPVVLGRFTGTDPRDGTTYDDDEFSVRVADPEASPLVTVSGSAEALDAWLWHRRDDSAVTITLSAPDATPTTGAADPQEVRDRFLKTLSQPLN
jgi:uncharacterized protein (TIGR03083 family)